MSRRTVATLLVAVSTSFAVPAFASGYGPAPFYHPLDGAPDSQRGQSAQTLQAGRAQENVMTIEAHGGSVVQTAQSGLSSAEQDRQLRQLYRGAH